MRFQLRMVFALTFVIVAIVGSTLVFKSFQRNPNELNLRLQWVVQAQFAGFIVADRLGFYAEEGLSVHVRPAGPDLKPLATVAAGTDDIGIGVSNQVALARSNGVPVKIIAQLFQDSANRYVLLSKNRITNLSDLKGKKIGLWLGGDEAEFVGMLATANMKLSDVQVIPQGFTVTPFLNGDYVLSEVTIYNELLEIEATLAGKDQLQILSPSDYKSAIVSDMLAVTEKTIKDRPEQLVRFLRASFRGWQYSIENPEKTVDLLLAANPELKRDEQIGQLRAVIGLMTGGIAKNEIGRMRLEDYDTTIRVLRESGQLSRPITANEMYDDSLWKKAR